MSGKAQEENLLRRAGNGDKDALAALFEQHRSRLSVMIRLRLDRRVAARVSPSDVLQDTFLDVIRRFPEFLANPGVPFYVWLRNLSNQRLVDLHRRHLGPNRNAGRDLSLNNPIPEASSACLAEQLLDKFMSPPDAVHRAQLEAQLQKTLNAMEPVDREVLVLRHFEDLSNIEAAAELGLTPTAASKRYIRALRRLKTALDSVPGFSG